MLARADEQNLHVIYIVRKLILHTFCFYILTSTCISSEFFSFLHMCIGVPLYIHRTLIMRTVYLAGIWTTAELNCLMSRDVFLTLVGR